LDGLFYVSYAGAGILNFDEDLGRLHLGPYPPALREDNEVHLRLVAGDRHPSHHIRPYPETLQCSLQPAGARARLLEILTFHVVLKQQRGVVRLNVFKDVTCPVTVDLFFPMIVDLKFLEQPLNHVSLCQDAYQFPTRAINYRESSQAGLLELADRQDQRVIIVQGIKFPGHPLLNRTVLVSVGQPLNKILDADKTHQAVLIDHRES